MSSESLTVFCPAHITCFFDPHSDRNLRKCGSRGAGFSVTLGATTKVTLSESKEQSIEVQINGKKVDAKTTIVAVKNLIKSYPLRVKIEIKQALPMSQGFGMSGAGALSASIGVAKLLGLSRMDAIESAHMAEVVCKTGLGDVIAQSFGGIEIRRSPGLPPWGMIEHLPGDYEVILCVLGKKMSTPSILSNPDMVRRIKISARHCLTSLLDNPSMENLLSLSYAFMNSTGLASEKIKMAVDVARNYGLASMCMLGNSIFAIGESDELERMLSVFGKVYRCRIDKQGARILD
ncbi:MAG TPA: pantothenate kinase [Thermoplasmatales archaeon]|nr:pantothenate kinase [Thermoplasmatales archaeon]